MHSVADQLRREQRSKALELSPEQRVARAFSLGDEAVAHFSASQGIDLDESRRRLRQQRQVGRLFSQCLQILPT